MAGPAPVFAPPSAPPLTGAAMALGAFALALSNFVVVLDITIANVSVPHISGSLAVSPSQGTWVITSYAVAEAICVPLTGWLAARFGAVRVFLLSLIGFGFFSLLCGLSQSLEALIAFRVMQGLCGAPIMPMSQTLLLRIFPPQKGQRGAGPVGDDHGLCADCRPDPGRADFRQSVVALDLFHQSSDRRGVRHGRVSPDPPL